jgi:hypothetical protein
VIAVSATDNPTLFQVFLTDGTRVVSYGEYARVGDRIIFSMPIGALTSEPQLHVVNLPAAAVDWESTARYADSVRFSHYVATKAESDYTALTAQVAAQLNQIVLSDEPDRRLELALNARRTLAAWPRQHYGYRARDVEQMLGFLDEAISEMRAAAGGTAFNVELIAVVEPPPAIPPIANPTPAESISQALAVAKLSDVPAERVSLLKAVAAAIENPANALPAASARSMKKLALWYVNQEAWVDREYSRLSTATLRRASRAAARADVREVEALLDGIRKRDQQLGGKRPDAVNALVATVQTQLDAARRLRLVRDQWTERVGAFRAYEGAVGPIVSALTRAQRGLDDIKRLAGPEASALASLTIGLDGSAKILPGIPVPDELKPAHALLESALALSANAVRARRLAVSTGNLDSAWEASSAAAAAMMLFSRSRADMQAVVRFPQAR